MLFFFSFYPNYDATLSNEHLAPALSDTGPDAVFYPFFILFLSLFLPPLPPRPPRLHDCVAAIFSFTSLSHTNAVGYSS